MSTSHSYVDLDAPISAEDARAIRALDSNALILRLHFTVHHLSRWLTPIHDRNRLERSLYHGKPSPKQILLGMRDHELVVYPMMHVIAVQDDPDLDALPPSVPTPAQLMADQERSTVELMAQFRRLRQGTCSLLRSLPDPGWERKGYSRRHTNTNLLELAIDLVDHDMRYMRAMDQTLNEVGAREGIAEIQKTPYDKLLKLAPDSLPEV